MPLVCDSAEADLATIRSLEEKYEIVESKAVTNKFPIYQQYRETRDFESYAKGFAEFTRAYLYPFLKGICTKEKL